MIIYIENRKYFLLSLLIGIIYYPVRLKKKLHRYCWVEKTMLLAVFLCNQEYRFFNLYDIPGYLFSNRSVSGIPFSWGLKPKIQKSTCRRWEDSPSIEYINQNNKTNYKA